MSILNGPGSPLEKHVFDPFLTHFWSQKGPFSRHFGIFHGPKRVTTGSPQGLILNLNLLRQLFTLAAQKSKFSKLMFLILWPHKMTMQGM